MTDEEAIERVLADDVDCFGLLVEKYQKKVRGMIYNMTRDHHLSEDLGLDVFLDVYRSLPHFDSARSDKCEAASGDIRPLRREGQ